MPKPKPAQLKSPLTQARWSLRDSLAASALFLAGAAVVLWQNAHLAVLWDASYTLDTSVRIALGQMPYRDFPLVHSPLTFLIQAAIMRLTGRVFFHHVLYATIINGLATVLAWRIALRTLQGRLHAAWPVSLLLAAPLIPLGVYSILPFPSYDCDSAFSILLVIFLLQRLPEDSIASNSRWRFFATGAALPLSLFFKQNIGLPFLAAAFALILLLMLLQQLRHASASPSTPALGALFAGAVTTLVAASLLLHFTAGVRNYLHWTIQFASQRRLPGFQQMLAVYAEPSLLWSLPCVAAALALLHSRFAKVWVPCHPERSAAESKDLLLPVFGEKGGIQGSYFRSGSALILLAAPFLWALFSLFLSSDDGDRADTLLALWPLLLILSVALTLWNICRHPSLRPGLPAVLLAAINGTFLSQQLWGSTYAIWPLLVLLIAEMIAFLASVEPSCTAADAAPRTPFLAPALAAIIAAALLLCGGLYTASEERLSYARVLDEGPVVHSTLPALKGMAISGPFLPEFEELLRFSANEVPFSDGLILIPGEDPFYFATGRTPQFPVLLFDNATDPLSTPAQLVAEAERRKTRRLIVKRTMQMKEDPTPQREASLEALQKLFLPYRKLGSYDVYRRP
jgi:hypothetical protein